MSSFCSPRFTHPQKCVVSAERILKKMSKSTCLIFALPDLTCQGAELVLSLCDRRPVREDGAQPCLLLHARVQVVVNLLVMMTIRDGRGSYFFHGAGRGGERQGKKSTGRGGAGNPPFPTMRGGAGKGSKSAGRGGAGAGNILRVSAD